jgi:hypothetical protein
MRVQFYKPNAKVTGTACQFWVGDDGAIMGSLIKQDGWNQNTRSGSFAKNMNNPAKRVILKFSQAEVGEMIRAIDTNTTAQTNGNDGFYHRSQNQITKIFFGPYMRSEQQVGYSYSVQKEDKEDSTNKTNFLIGFTFAEGIVLKEALLCALRESFIQATPTKNYKSQNKQSQSEQAPQPAQQPQPVSQAFDDDEW